MSLPRKLKGLFMPAIKVSGLQRDFPFTHPLLL
jgi:hypothetical protein